MIRFSMDRPSAVSGIQLLLADDEETVAVTLGAVLRQAGYSVTTCSTASDGIGAIDDANFDIVISDLRLATVDDGLGILRRAKQKDPDVVAIMLTGWASTQSAIDALELGATAYLTKPCNLDQLKLTVFRGLETRREMRSIRHKAGVLERERNFVQLLLDNAPVGIYVLEGPEHQVTLVNPYALEIRGLTPEQVLGRRAEALLGSAYDTARGSIEEAIRTGELQRLTDLSVVLPNGRSLTLETLYHRLPDDLQGAPSVMSISVDVSPERAAREEAERARRELAEVLDRVGDGIFALDAEWRFRFINRAALAVSATYGLSVAPDAFLERTLWEVYPQILGTPLEEVYRTAMRDQVPAAIDMPPNPAGATLNVRIYPSVDGLTVVYHGRSDSVAIER